MKLVLNVMDHLKVNVDDARMICNYSSFTVFSYKINFFLTIEFYTMENV